MTEPKTNKSKEYGLGIAYYYKAQNVLNVNCSSAVDESIQIAKKYYQKSLDQLALLDENDLGYKIAKDLANNVTFRIEVLR